MATMNISLPQQMKDWVEQQAASGRYANASDYIRDLIRRDEERRMSIAELQAFVDEAMTSGPPQPFDLDAFLTQMHRKHGLA